MKNLILASLTALAGLSANAPQTTKHKKCECPTCFIKHNKNTRFNRKRKEAENTKSQENRNEEL